MPIATDSTLDVVNWLMDHALNDNEYLQPAKLHRLLFLAQAYYAVANHGRKLMPATFVADELGPLEPNVYRVFENGRPYIEPVPLSAEVKHFLESIWRRFGHHSVGHLNKVLKSHPPYVKARERGLRAEITLDSMVQFYGSVGKEKPVKPDALRARVEAGDVYRPRVMRTHKGKPVNVNKWMPPTHSKKNDGRKE